MRSATRITLGSPRACDAAALRLAFGPLRLQRVEASFQPRHRASIRLVKGLALRREGSSRRDLEIAGGWRDHARWALLLEDGRR